MKVTIVVEKENTAIDILSQAVKRHNLHFDIDVVAVHPKRPTDEQLERFANGAKDADILHFAYWKSADVLRERFDFVEAKKKLLVHYNPYDTVRDNRNWAQEYDAVVVVNRQQRLQLPYAFLIPLTIDLEFFTPRGEEPEVPAVGMVANRIEGSKGILQVAQACARLGVKFILVGRISNQRYFQQVQEAAGKYLDFREDVSDDELLQAYREMTVLVVNSKDNFETGPLPLLEAMASGVAVVTRRVGIVDELYDGKNMVVRGGAVDDIDDLVECLSGVLTQEQYRRELQREGLWAVKDRSHQWMARQFSSLYYALRSSKPLVSVIVPTFNRCETLPQVLASVEVHDYENLEIVVCDDSSTDATFDVVQKLRRGFRTPIKYVNTNNLVFIGDRAERTRQYGLASARNLGVIEAEGEYLLFLDDRLILALGAVEKMVDRIGSRRKLWLWGVKDGAKKGFVENFSFIRRDDFIEAGMFNERVQWYGGMSQEVRTRFERQGFTFERVDDAEAKSFIGSKRWRERFQDVVRAKLLLKKMYDV